jgi:hypothetical protein
MKDLELYVDTLQHVVVCCLDDGLQLDFVVEVEKDAEASMWKPG